MELRVAEIRGLNMARPVKKYPRRNVIAFRLNDAEMAALRYLASYIARDGESFNATIARVLKNTIKKAAEEKYADWRDACDTMMEDNVSVMRESPDKRRKKYRAYLQELREKTQEVCRQALEEAPERADFEKLTSPEKSTSQGELASVPSVVVSLAPGAAHTLNTVDGESTAKTENLARPVGGAAGDSAGKLEQFSEERGNSPFLLGDVLKNYLK